MIEPPSAQDPVEAFVERLALLSLKVVELTIGGAEREKRELDSGLAFLEAAAAGESDLLAYVARLRALLRGNVEVLDSPFPIPGPYAAMWAEIQTFWREEL